MRGCSSRARSRASISNRAACRRSTRLLIATVAAVAAAPVDGPHRPSRDRRVDRVVVPDPAARGPRSVLAPRSWGEGTYKVLGALDRDFRGLHRLSPGRGLPAPDRLAGAAQARRPGAGPGASAVRCWLTSRRTGSHSCPGWSGSRRTSSGGPRLSRRGSRASLVQDDGRLVTLYMRSVKRSRAAPMDFMFIAVDQTFHVSRCS